MLSPLVQSEITLARYIMLYCRQASGEPFEATWLPGQLDEAGKLILPAIAEEQAMLSLLEQILPAAPLATGEILHLVPDDSTFSASTFFRKVPGLQLTINRFHEQVFFTRAFWKYGCGPGASKNWLRRSRRCERGFSFILSFVTAKVLGVIICAQGFGLADTTLSV